MGVYFRKLKKKGRRMKRFILNLIFPMRKKQNTLIWHHINNCAGNGIAGYNAYDKKTPIRRQNGYQS